MTKPGTLYALSLLLAALAAAPALAGPREARTLEAAAEVLRDAQAVAVLPHVLKAGLFLDGRFGRGVLLVRRPDGCWGEPVFVSLAGGGVGWQIGVQSTDLVLVFRTASSVDRILRGQGQLTLGGDASVAAGPLGREAEAATDGRLRAEVYSYSRSRGLFAGLALQGAVLRADGEANAAFYGPRGVPADDAAAAERLREALSRLGPPPAPVPPVPVVVPR
jgi:lipid-binding SYLF domain-containing protein